MPDSISVFTAQPLSEHEVIHLHRRPLPAHDRTGGNFCQWARAVCEAEVAHRRNDWERACHDAGRWYDLWAEPAAVQIGQYDHEAHAGVALNWLIHLSAHDSNRHGPWADWHIKTREEKAGWLRRRRELVHGFLRQMRRYAEARCRADQFVSRRAA